MANRFDASKITTHERTAQGYLKVRAPITRSGIFEYRKADGSVVRELRKPENVFDTASLSTFEGAPLVNTTELFPGVPAGHTPMLTPANTAQHQKGTVFGLTRSDARLEATILVTDAQTIADIDAGKRELSCGYSCDVVFESGEYEGQKYDAVQENIVGNHVALVSRGRAGSEIAIRLDSADAIDISSDEKELLPEQHTRKLMTVKMKFDSVEVEVPEAIAEAISKERAAHEAAIVASDASLAKQTARADSADAALIATKAELANAPAKVRADIKTELALHARAAKVLGSESLEGKSVAAVREAVLAKLNVKTEGKDASYIEARFDAEMERFEAGAAPAPKTEEIKSDAADSLEAKFEAMNKAAANAYKVK